MASFAIVIGIDAYAVESWNLSGAVKDALAFVRWVTERGGVADANLRLLLSTTAPDADGRLSTLATCQAIRDAILEFQQGAGANGDRLFFYYAGHGVSAPGATTGPQEPVIVPADVTSLQRQPHLLLGFSEIIPALRDVAPREQFFFVDACRDFALEHFQPGVGRGAGAWVPPPADPALRTKQFVIYATAPGQRAYEETARGRGVFGRFLVEGLRGAAPALMWSPGRGQYEVRFSRLFEHVKQSVEREIETLKTPAATRDWQHYVQIPEPHLLGAPDAVLDTIDRVPEIPITVRVGPSMARPNCQIAFLQYAPGGLQVTVKALGPPTPLPASFALPPGDYSLRAAAPAFEEFRQPCGIYRPDALDIKLRSSGDTLERLAVEAVEPATGAVAADLKGTLVAESSDRTQLIAIRNSAGEVVQAGAGWVSVVADAGLYTVQLLAPGGVADQRIIELFAGAKITVPLSAAPPRMGDALLDQLAASGFTVDARGYFHASENLGPMSDVSLASLLAFAAFAVHTGTQFAGFERLRSLGVRAFTDVPEGHSAVLVLTGAAGERPAPGIDREQFVAGGRVSLKSPDGAIAARGLVTPLEKLPAAGQFGVPVDAGCIIAELSLPGVAPTYYAVAALPNRVAVLVVVAHDSGEMEVQQYLLPTANAKVPDEFLRMAPSHIRLLEIAQRQFGRQRELSLPSQELDLLLYGKWHDPLLGCLAGYSLVRQGMADRYIGQPDAQPHPNRPENSAMRNMLKFFGELPDSHVLAGLCQPAERAEHYARAVERGLPVFADGLRALYEFFHDRTDGPARLARAMRGLPPGSPWTAWVLPRPALIVQRGRFAAAPPQWDALERERPSIERTIASVGRIETTGNAVPFVGTGFLVAEDVVMTARYVLDAFAERAADGRWMFKPGVSAAIDFAEELGGTDSMEVEINEVLYASEYPPIALLRVAKTSRRGVALPPPLTLATRIPEPFAGRRVYVVGYPAYDRRGVEEVQRRVFNDVYGVKRLQPGEVIDFGSLSDVAGGASPEAAADRTRFLHDCLTLSGNGGSCVVDLETHRVIGLHYAGKYLECKVGEAVVLWPLEDLDALKPLALNFSA